MKKRGKRFARWLLTGFFMMVIGICSLAAQEDYVFYIVGENASEMVTFGVAVVIENNGSYYAITTMDVVDSSAETYHIWNDDEHSYEVDFTGRGFSEYGLGMFAFRDQVPPETKILGLAGAFQGQTADLLYLDTEVTMASRKLRITGAQAGKSEQLTLLGWEFASEGENVQEIFCFPLFVMDDQNGLVGLIIDSGELISFHTDVNAFYGQGSSGETKEAEETSGASGRERRRERGNETGTEIETKIEPETAGGSKTDIPGDDGLEADKKWLYLLGAVGAAFVGVVIVKNKTGSSSKSAPTDPILPDSVRSAPIPPDPVRPVPIPPGPVPSGPIPAAPDQARASLTGTSGIMQGRTYPIGSQGVSIGREAFCGIRFPEDTKGISRNHCKLYWNEKGVLMIMDCGSSYGTYLTNYGKLQDHRPVPVKNGDMFCLGSEKNTFVIRYL